MDYTERELIAGCYVRRIKNDAKRSYAEAYLAWLRGGEIGDSPEYTDLSYMVAQAVRMQLREAYGE